MDRELTECIKPSYKNKKSDDLAKSVLASLQILVAGGQDSLQEGETTWVLSIPGLPCKAAPQADVRPGLASASLVGSFLSCMTK